MGLKTSRQAAMAHGGSSTCQAAAKAQTAPTASRPPQPGSLRSLQRLSQGMAPAMLHWLMRYPQCTVSRFEVWRLVVTSFATEHVETCF